MLGKLKIKQPLPILNIGALSLKHISVVDPDGVQRGSLELH